MDIATKVLEIIIPRFKESEYLSYNLFASLNTQLNFDFRLIRITLVQDGDGVELSPEYLKQFKNLEINYFKLNKNVGAGLTRQFGIDNSESDYILFIDQDDMLFSCRSMYDMLNCIILNKDADIIQTKWYEQKNGNLINMESQATWVHGTIFKRDFLTRNNIKFHEDLRISEDSYFVSLCLMLCNYGKLGNVIKMTSDDLRSILWCDNPNSTVRSQYHIHEVFLWHIKAMYYLCEECKKRNINIERKVVSTIYYIGFAVNSYAVNFKDKNYDIAKEIKFEMMKFYNEFKSEYDKVDLETKIELFNENKRLQLSRLSPAMKRKIDNLTIKQIIKEFK